MFHLTMPSRTRTALIGATGTAMLASSSSTIIALAGVSALNTTAYNDLLNNSTV